MNTLRFKIKDLRLNINMNIHPFFDLSSRLVSDTVPSRWKPTDLLLGPISTTELLHYKILISQRL